MMLFKRTCGWCKQVKLVYEFILGVLINSKRISCVKRLECIVNNYKVRWYRELIRPYVQDEFYFGGIFMKEIILFIACFILVFICYQVFFILPMKKYRKNKKNGKKKKIKEKC